MSISTSIWTVLVLAVLSGHAKPIRESSQDPENLGSEYNQGPDIFEGDIKLPPIQMAKNGILQSNYLWRYRKVSYYISEDFSAEDRINIEESMEEYHRKTCIRFVPLLPLSKRPPWMDDYIMITSENTGCHSYVGRRGDGQQLNLQSPGCMSRGTIIHELMHAIGFWHEQSRPDRDEYVTINKANIPEDKLSNFNTYGWDTVTVLDEPYDYESVMHYDSYAFTNVSSIQTIIPKQENAVLGQRLDFSLTDIKKINRRYACS